MGMPRAALYPDPVELIVLPDHYDYDSVIKKIEMVGKVTGKTTEAQAMIERGRGDMQALKDKQPHA